MKTIRGPGFLRALFYIQAPLWFIVGLIYLLTFGLRTGAFLPVFLAAVMMLFSFWFILIGFYLGRKSRIAYAIAVLTMLLVILAGFADDFGLADFLFLVLNLFILLALILSRRVFCTRGD